MNRFLFERVEVHTKQGQMAHNNAGARTNRFGELEIHDQAGIIRKVYAHGYWSDFYNSGKRIKISVKADR